MYDDQGRHKRRGSADAIFPGFGRGVLEEAGPGPRTLTEKFASVEAKFPVRVLPSQRTSKDGVQSRCGFHKPTESATYVASQRHSSYITT